MQPKFISRSLENKEKGSEELHSALRRRQSALTAWVPGSGHPLACGGGEARAPPTPLDPAPPTPLDSAPPTMGPAPIQLGTRPLPLLTPTPLILASSTLPAHSNLVGSGRAPLTEPGLAPFTTLYAPLPDDSLQMGSPPPGPRVVLRWRVLVRSSGLAHSPGPWARARSTSLHAGPAHSSRASGLRALTL